MKIHVRSRAAGYMLLMCLTIVAVSGCPDPPDINEVGGVIYVYALDATDEGATPNLTDELKRSTLAVLRTRLDPTGELGIRVSFNPADELEIAVPGQDAEVQSQVQARVASPGKLEFLILANTTDHADLIEQARETPSRVVRVDGAVVGRWVNAQTATPSGNIEYRGLSQDELILRDGVSGNPVIFSADERIRVTSNQFAAQSLMAEKKVTDLEVLVAVDTDPMKTFQGEHLAFVAKEMNNAAQPCIGFRTTSGGAEILKSLTSANLPDRQTGLRRKLGIILDDVLLSAPAIMGTISNAGQITGNFSEDEIAFIVNVLKSGELPIALTEEPIRVVEVAGEQP